MRNWLEGPAGAPINRPQIQNDTNTNIIHIQKCYKYTCKYNNQKAIQYIHMQHMKFKHKIKIVRSDSILKQLLNDFFELETLNLRIHIISIHTNNLGLG